jgi:hypothetical protein
MILNASWVEQMHDATRSFKINKLGPLQLPKGEGKYSPGRHLIKLTRGEVARAINTSRNREGKPVKGLAPQNHPPKETPTHMYEYSPAPSFFSGEQNREKG